MYADALREIRRLRKKAVNLEEIEMILAGLNDAQVKLDEMNYKATKLEQEQADRLAALEAGYTARQFTIEADLASRLSNAERDAERAETKRDNLVVSIAQTTADYEDALEVRVAFRKQLEEEVDRLVADKLMYTAQLEKIKGEVAAMRARFLGEIN